MANRQASRLFGAAKKSGLPGGKGGTNMDQKQTEADRKGKNFSGDSRLTGTETWEYAVLELVRKYFPDAEAATLARVATDVSGCARAAKKPV